MAQIVDQFGRPISSREVRQAMEEPQTAQLTSLQQTFAGHPSRGLTPSRLAAILDSAEQGNLTAQADLFVDMEEKDAHIFAEMGKRRRALLGIDWKLDPPRGATAAEKRQAEELAEWVRDIPDLEDVILDCMDAAGHGFACLEIERWQLVDRVWLPADLQHRPQSWFLLDLETRTELRLRDNTAQGAPLQPFGWIVHTHRAKSGYLSRAGIHRVLAWPYLFKAYSVRDWAEFLEIYGIPPRVGTYPTNATAAEQRTLLSAVSQLGHSAAGIIPEGMAIEFKELAQGDGKAFADLVDWAERSESKAILGQTLSAEAHSTGLGSGVADLQGEVRRDLRDSDARQIEGTLSRDLLYPILAVNGRIDNPRRTPRFRFDLQDPEDLKTYSEALPPLVNIGLQIPARWAADKLQIPEPAKGEAVLGTRAAPPVDPNPPPADPNAAPPQAAAKAAPPGAGEPNAQPDLVDHQLDRLVQDAGPALGAVLDRIRAALDQAIAAGKSPREFQRDLIGLYADLDPAAQARALRLAFAAAELAGMADIAESP